MLSDCTPSHESLTSRNTGVLHTSAPKDVPSTSPKAPVLPFALVRGLHTRGRNWTHANHPSEHHPGQRRIARNDLSDLLHGIPAVSALPEEDE